MHPCLQTAYNIGAQIAKAEFLKVSGLGGGLGGVMLGPIGAAAGGGIESGGYGALGGGLGSSIGGALGLLAPGAAKIPFTLLGSDLGGHIGQELLRKPKGIEYITGK